MTDLIQAFRENPVFTDMSYGYTRLRDEEILYPDGTRRREKTGAILQDNGDILFRIYAPEACDVRVEVTIDPETPDIILQKDDQGFFTGLLPYQERLAGPKTINYYVDGALMLHPQTPIFYWNFRPANYIEVPDREQLFLLSARIPRGTVHRKFYWSKIMDEFESCLVYTPPGYSTEKKYPVLYLQHGHTEDETCWIYNGKAGYILDALIAEGSAVPMIIVMNNGMLRKPGETDQDYAGFMDMLLSDCLPFIEERYSVLKDKWSRAIAGLSMGSAQASLIGQSHPELFGYVGLFSGFLALSRPDKPIDELPYLQMLFRDHERFLQEFRVFYRSIGALDGLKARFDLDSEYLKKHGSDTLPNLKSIIYPNRFHDWGTWRIALRDFARMIFR